jgi:hypothetical protein
MTNAVQVQKLPAKSYLVAAVRSAKLLAIEIRDDFNRLILNFLWNAFRCHCSTFWKESTELLQFCIYGVTVFPHLKLGASRKQGTLPE